MVHQIIIVVLYNMIFFIYTLDFVWYDTSCLMMNFKFWTIVHTRDTQIFSTKST
jgi:hypothetical protein